MMALLCQLCVMQCPYIPSSVASPAALAYAVVASCELVYDTIGSNSCSSGVQTQTT